MGIRDLFETEIGLIFATTMHALGAIGLVAALVMFIALAKRVRTDAQLGDLRLATAWVLWVSVAANLIGGFMRTYLPGHPTIKALGHSDWVQVMLLKHAFIFAAMGAMVHLHHVVGPWLIKRQTAGMLAPRVPTAQAVSVFIVGLGVVVASVLGAFAQITPLGDEHDGDGSPPDTIIEDSDDNRLFSASSSLTSTPITPSADRGTFQVQPSVVELSALFSYDATTGSTLALEFTNPKGDTIDVPGDGQMHNFPALAGVWNYAVSSDLAVDVAWTLDVTMSLAGNETTALVETFTIAPNTFFEINTIMPEGGTFCWDWQSTDELAFDVHSHFDDEVQYLIERTSDGEYDCFTNEREGGYSLLWENGNAVPVTLDYRFWGEFTVDSYFPPR